MSEITLLHLADVHLGIENYGRPDPATGLNSRVGDFLACLDQAIDEAIERPVDLVVFAGDAYKNRDPNPTHQRELAKRVARLSRANIPVVLLVGNHDLPAATGRASSVDIFQTLGVPNVTVARTPDIFRIETRSGPVQVGALPWILRNTLFTKEEYKNLTLEEIDREVGERVARILASFAERLEPDIPAVLTAHCSVAGATFGSERSILLGQDIVLPKSTLAAASFDYVALGHIHKHQVIGTDPLIVYAGSIDRVDFGEEREDKGYVVAKVWRGGAEYEFRPVNARRFVTLEIDASGTDPLGVIDRALEEADLDGTVVRVLIDVPAEHEVAIREHDREIRRLLRDASYVAAVARNVKRLDRPTGVGLQLERLTPL
ncbi:MAG: exonuclease SbcCD subunit D, partial [Chloroflexi bacterium]|nr:exonuclease SbcCD subunit D [Chloroflexota bacterium]